MFFNDINFVSDLKPDLVKQLNDRRASRTDHCALGVSTLTYITPLSLPHSLSLSLSLSILAHILLTALRKYNLFCRSSHDHRFISFKFSSNFTCFSSLGSNWTCRDLWSVWLLIECFGQHRSLIIRYILIKIKYFASSYIMYTSLIYFISEIST